MCLILHMNRFGCVCVLSTPVFPSFSFYHCTYRKQQPYGAAPPKQKTQNIVVLHVYRMVSRFQCVCVASVSVYLCYECVWSCMYFQALCFRPSLSFTGSAGLVGTHSTKQIEKQQSNEMRRNRDRHFFFLIHFSSAIGSMARASSKHSINDTQW